MKRLFLLIAVLVTASLVLTFASCTGAKTTETPEPTPNGTKTVKPVNTDPKTEIKTEIKTDVTPTAATTAAETKETVSPTPTTTEKKSDFVPKSFKGSFSTDTGTYLNMDCDWELKEIGTSGKYNLTVMVILDSYSIYVTQRSNAKLKLGDETTTFTTPDISIDAEAGRTKTFFTSKTIELTDDQLENGVDLFVSWGFHGSYSGVPIDTLEINGIITFN